MRPRSYTFIVCQAIVVAVLWAGCNEEIVTPPSVAYPFSMYGVLTPELDTQSVLVNPVEALPQGRASEPLDALVSSTDLTTGETRMWKDSLTVDALGLVEHVFWSDFRAAYGHRYRIDVVRPSDGATSYTKEVRVPEPVIIELEDSNSERQILHIRGDATSIVKADLTYTVRFYNPNTQPPPDAPFVSYTFNYWGQQTETEDGWAIEIPLMFDHLKMRAWYALDTEWGYNDFYDGIAWIAMSLEVVVGDSVWSPPTGIFDPNVIGQPEIMDNVESGFGFVGGGYRQEQKLFPPQEALERAGFHYAPLLVWW